jgi:transposase-like protein
MSKRISDEIKMQIIAEVKEVGSVPTVAKKHGLLPKRIYNWMRATTSSVNTDQNKQIRELNKKLKEAELENLVLKELLKKTYPRWQNAESV